ncbi:MAG: uroporphyrinogen decarboxylase [Elusimicrobia bacterium]|nr:uroporphyrinogen decarboxylase [Candidatus Obscuribacterium magneticum]
MKNIVVKKPESLFIRACRSQPAERTPIWLMRQAGRYQKFYRDIRSKVSFIDLCKNPSLAAEVTVRATRELDVDAAIIFSDILLILEPMGAGLSYEKENGPEIAAKLNTEEDVERLRAVDADQSLSFVFEAIKITRKSLAGAVPLIGFAGGPFTLASYLLEGGKSKDFARTKALMKESPQVWNLLLHKLSEATVQYGAAQVEAGAQAVQIFDSWVGVLTSAEYVSSVLPHAKYIFENLRELNVPLIHFGTGTGPFLKEFCSAGADVIGIDQGVKLSDAWEPAGSKAVQGNMDPALLLKSKDEIKKAAADILREARGRPGHIFNLGHGVLPQTPEENVHYLVQTVKELSSK